MTHSQRSIGRVGTIAATETTGVFKFRQTDMPWPAMNMPLVIRATTLDERGWPVVCDAPLELVVPSRK